MDGIGNGRMGQRDRHRANITSELGELSALFYWPLGFLSYFRLILSFLAFGIAMHWITWLT